MMLVKIPFIGDILELNRIQCSVLETQFLYDEESLEMFRLDFYASNSSGKNLGLWLNLMEISQYHGGKMRLQNSYFFLMSEPEFK